MRIRGTLFTIIVLLALIFAVANWETVTTALPVALLFWSVQVPLGLILLAATVILTGIFFFASLVERASQLRQLSHLERQIEQLRDRLEQKRLEELEGIERAFRERTDKLEGVVREQADALELALGERLAEQEMRTRDRIDGVGERVVLVRDELAADVAQAEDLLRRMIEGDRELPPAT